MANTVDIEIADLQNRYEGDLSTFDPAYLDTQIADAQAYILSTYPMVQYRLNSFRLSTQSYVRVVANMVFRVIRNPAGFSSEGDGAYSYSYWRNTASGALTLTPDEIVILTGATGGGMGTIGINLDAGWQ